MPRPRGAAAAVTVSEPTEDNRPVLSAEGGRLDPDTLRAAMAEAPAYVPATPEAPRPERKFAKSLAAPVEAERMVTVRVTRRGADRIATGRHEPMLGDEYYAEGETFRCPLSVAIAQSDGDENWRMTHTDEFTGRVEPKDYVEIIGD